MKKVLFLFAVLFLSTSTFGFTPSSLEEVSTKTVMESKNDKTFIFFWATWCTSCKAKLKTIIPELQTKKNVDVLTINIDKNPRRVKHYLKKNGIKVPVFRVKQGANENIVEKLKVRTAPQWVYMEKKDGKWEIKNHEKAFDITQVKNLFKNI